MVRNIKLTLSFDGTDLSGWQRQKEGRTVQGHVEQAIQRMTNNPVNLIGAGRTDAGVHARAMTANFTTSSAIPPQAFQNGLNSLLPADIRVMAVAEVPLTFHSRKDAVAKIYDYHFSLSHVLHPLDRLYCTHFPAGKSFLADAVRNSLSFLIGEHDFSSFEATGSRINSGHGRGAVRRVFSAKLFGLDEGTKKYYFRLVGDGFLRHMVRNIVGTCMEIGFGKRPVADMEAILLARDRQTAGPTAPARGLTLTDVIYNLDYPDSSRQTGKITYQ